jgi:hypothetical protein
MKTVSDLTTKKDLAQLCYQWIKTPFDHLVNGSLNQIGSTGIHYKEKTIRFEYAARLMLGIGPLIKSGTGIFPKESVDDLRTLIVEGFDPNHPNYFGLPSSDYQLLLDMPDFMLGILHNIEILWDDLDPKYKKNVENWCAYTNKCFIAPNNQTLFKVGVNTFLGEIGSAEYNEEELEKCYAIIDDMYVGDGIYEDGKGSGVVDYYNSWVIHYFSLIHASLTKNLAIKEKYYDRARKFAQVFKYWFTKEGVAIPYGRSMCYRSAMVSFFAAAAYADLEVLPWGEIKAICFEHLRWWTRQNEFLTNDQMSIGYAYPNLKISEQYNSPGSPYFALTSMILLSVPDDSPFWKSAEKCVTKEQALISIPCGGHLIATDETDQHTTLYTAGGNQGYGGIHYAEKYLKFAYSTHAGFTVPTGCDAIDRLAADNMLLLKDEAGNFYRKTRNISYNIEKNEITTTWSPAPFVTVTTRITVVDSNLHFRSHHIESTQRLWAYEGGFSLRRSDALYDYMVALARTEKRIELMKECEIDYSLREACHTHGFQSILWNEHGFTAIWDLDSMREGTVIKSTPNANVLYPNALIPMIENELRPGTIAIHAGVYVNRCRDIGKIFWERKPNLSEVQTQWLRCS